MRRRQFIGAVMAAGAAALAAKGATLAHRFPPASVTRLRVDLA